MAHETITNEYGTWRHGAGERSEGGVKYPEVWYSPHHTTVHDPEIALIDGKYIVRPCTDAEPLYTLDTLDAAMVAFTLIYN